MICIQVVPTNGNDAYKLLRAKVIHDAQTWEWKNKAKTRLRHKSSKKGYIDVGHVKGVLIARVHPDESKEYYLPEKFIGRLIAWFPDELFLISIQFIGGRIGMKHRRIQRKQ